MIGNKTVVYTSGTFDKAGYFETGGAYPFLRDGKYKGLNDFKKCFGTFIHPIYKGEYHANIIQKKLIFSG